MNDEVLHHASYNIEYPTISSLPAEILEMIFIKLETKDLLNCRAISKLWQTCCTRLCSKRLVCLKSIKSMEKFEEFKLVFHEIQEFPWSSYNFFDRYIDLVEGFNLKESNGHYLFIQDFGKYLKTLHLGEIEFRDCSINAFFGYLPNLVKIYLDSGSLALINNLVPRDGEVYNFCMPKLREIKFVWQDYSIPVDSIAYLVLQSLCKGIKHLELKIDNGFDYFAAKSFAEIFCQPETVNLKEFTCNPMLIKVLSEKNVKISKIGLSICLYEKWSQEAYENLVLALSTKLTQMKLYILHNVLYQKPFRFPTLPVMSSMVIKFYEGCWCKTAIQIKLESYLSDLTPCKVPMLNSMKLISPLVYKDVDCSIQKNLSIFKNGIQFENVRYVYAKGFHNLIHHETFPRAKIISVEC